MPHHFNFSPEDKAQCVLTDEATFHVSGLVHRHNVRIWGKENPHEVQEFERDSPKLNVWCGMFSDRLIGPFFFDELTVCQDNFLKMLKKNVLPCLGSRQVNMILQLDGCPAHFGLRVREFLDTQFPGRWIGRVGPTQWPPRSPDLTPIDFFCGVSSKPKCLLNL